MLTVPSTWRDSTVVIGIAQAARSPRASATCLVSAHSGSAATSATSTGARRCTAVPLDPARGPTTMPSASCRPVSTRLGAAATVSVSPSGSSSSTAQRAPSASLSTSLASADSVSISGASLAIRSSTAAWPASRPSACLRSLTSRVLNTTPRTAGSSSRLLASASRCRQVPSPARQRNS